MVREHMYLSAVQVDLESFHSQTTASSSSSSTEYFSESLKQRLANAVGFSSSLPCFCQSATQRPVLHASVVTMFCLLLLKMALQSSVVISSFILLKSVLRSSSQSRFTPFLKTVSCCLFLSQRLDMNFA